MRVYLRARYTLSVFKSRLKQSNFAGPSVIYSTRNRLPPALLKLRPYSISQMFIVFSPTSTKPQSLNIALSKV